MNGMRLGVCAVAAGLLGMLVLGGCPESALLPDLGGGDPGGTNPADEAKVLRVLSETLEADVSSPDETPSDEDAYFGEEGGLYDEVPPEAVEIPEEDITAEAETPNGFRPVIHGRLAGRFLNDRPDSTSDESGGVFRGRWFTAGGEVEGVLRGEYHPLPPDQLPGDLAGGGVFRGKYIDTEGRFRGFLHGRYGHGPEGRGLFFGRWVDRHHRLVGVLKGHWDDDPEINGGTFAGRWAAFNICAEADSLPEFEFEDGDFGGLDESDEDLEAPQPPDANQPPIDEEHDAGIDQVLSCIDPDLPFGFIRGWHAPHPPCPLHGPRPEADQPPPDGPPPGPCTCDGPGPELDDPELEPPAIPPPEHPVDGGGWFHMRWRMLNGHLVALVKGHYRPLPPEPPADEIADGPVAAEMPGPIRPPARIMGVFYGRLFHPSGRFRGFVRGVFGRSVHGVGVFRGRYFDADGQERGVLRGHWARHPMRPGGPIVGIWNGMPVDEEEPGSTNEEAGEE